jgi:hypothetical protein
MKTSTPKASEPLSLPKGQADGSLRQPQPSLVMGPVLVTGVSLSRVSKMDPARLSATFSSTTRMGRTTAVPSRSCPPFCPKHPLSLRFRDLLSFWLVAALASNGEDAVLKRLLEDRSATPSDKELRIASRDAGKRYASYRRDGDTVRHHGGSGMTASGHPVSGIAGQCQPS